MKVFQINCDSIAAESLAEAQQWWDANPNRRCPIDPDIVDEIEEPREIPEDRLKSMKLFDEDTGFHGPMWDYLQKLIADGHKFPCGIGCSEY